MKPTNARAHESIAARTKDGCLAGADIQLTQHEAKWLGGKTPPVSAFLSLWIENGSVVRDDKSSALKIPPMRRCFKKQASIIRVKVTMFQASSG